MARTISDLVENLGEWRARMDSARASIGSEIHWYPYDTLGNIAVLNHLLHGDNRDLQRLTGGSPVADIGGADGDLAFALEGVMGWEMDLIDNAPTNFNRLRAAHALREHLRSRVRIEDIDLDTQFRLPRERYGLVLLLGILYHLQNPFYVLFELGKRAEHCVVSTRVARFAGPAPTPIAEIPVAYLVAPYETNNDSTNYWMFSPAGLERIVERTGWSVLEKLTGGDVEASDPSSPDHDERTFMLLRSNHPR